MKYYLRLTTLLVVFCVSLTCPNTYGQQHVMAKNGLTAGVKNYTSFTSPYKDRNPEVAKANRGYESHPELGQLFAETPCDNCYELIAERTEISKTFIKEGTNGRDIMLQSSSAPMHYRDAKGNWRTIKSQLEKGTLAGVYAATEQPMPLTISATEKYTSLGKATENLRFNNKLELMFEAPGGGIVSLGVANWSHHTAGDDGVYVTNAWPGIDIEIFTIRGAVKTNYIIHNAMPAYAGGKLLIRDHLQMSNGLKLNVTEQTAYADNLEVSNASGMSVYHISAPNAYEKNNAKPTFQMLVYNISNNVVDIVLPGNFLNRPATSYPVIIDPLVSTSTNSVVNGSTYSPGPLWTVGCTYSNPATVPAKVSISDIQYSFQYVTAGGALLNNGAFDFRLGGCRSPSVASIFWNCNSNLTGTCTGTNASIGSSLFSCMPAPQCNPYNLNLTMNLYQNYTTEAACGTSYIYAGSPLNITVFGHTIDNATATGFPGTICSGQSVSLSASAQNGIPPYTYTWYPGPLTGSPVSATPAATTTYTLVASDACGGTSTTTTTVNVFPSSTITGNTQVCQGSTTQLTDAAAGGTWSSSNTSIATISSTGLVTGVTGGTSVISYITPSTCYATTSVTVKPAPGTITGIANVCAGNTTMLSSTTPGGTWTSSNTNVAVINNSGMVTGITGGVTRITYTGATGCTTSTSLTVSPLAITGTTTVCAGGTTQLNNIAGSGTWTSTNTNVATITPAGGLVTGVSAGTSTITFISAGGCISTTTVTITTLPNISGTTTICQGGSTTLSNATGGGTWSSANTAVAQVTTNGGIVTGTGGGTTTISYNTTGGCLATTSLTVNPITPISGASTICQGSSTTMSDATPGGTWSCTNTNIATVVANSGVVSGATNGTTSVIYTTTAGCSASKPINVVALPSPITGNTTLCNSGVLSDATTGGIWASSNSAVATINSSTGAITALSVGNATITYTIPGGCSTTVTVSVSLVSPITGIPSLCANGTTTLSDATPGGTWTSSNTVIGTINPSTGIITGVSGGNVMVSYTLPSGCGTGVSVTVNPISPIGGSTTVCQSATITLSNATTGGTWASGAIGVATVGTTSGVVTGVAAGNAPITYTMPTGCRSTTTVTVNPIAPITGNTTICAGSTTTLSDATAGGTWGSNNTAIASVDPANGVVTGVATGTTIIRYTTAAGCSASTSVTVNTLPGAIAGIKTVCQGGTTSLSDTPTGGTWSSGTTAIATINTVTGVVTGVSAGNTTIVYTTTAGCTATTTVTVNPTAPITGTTSLCAGEITTLSNAVSGGTWSSANTLIASIDVNTGQVTGLSAGNTTITYTLGTGCIRTASFTVNPMPGTIAGNTTLCQGSTSALSNAVSGGTWSSGTPAVATITTSGGVVNPVNAGSTIITYATPAGCSVTTTVTVNPLSPITGIASVCVNSSTILSDATTGGTWSSVNTNTATVDINTGVVTGVNAGVVNIRYTTTLGCVATVSLTVYPLPTAIGGNTTVCVSSTTALSNGITGGAWTSGTTSVATVNASTGVVTGVSAGLTLVTYTTAAGCVITEKITVNPLPDVITGVTSICRGATTSLSDATAGGTWSSSNATIATINTTSGFVTGLNVGSAIATYTSLLNCSVTTTVTINPLPSAISGSLVTCEGMSIQLSNSLAGGTWSSSNTAIATITSNTGVMYGVTAGTTSITYITPAGCLAVATATVNPTPNVISTSFTNPTTCVTNDGTITLHGLTPGANFIVQYFIGSTGTVSPVTANSSGDIVITGLAAGTYTNIRVTSTLGCNSDLIIGPIVLTLPPNPATPVAGNNAPVCDGATLQLTATCATAGVGYSWAGPLSFTTTVQNPVISPVSLANSGTYTVTATKLGCKSAPATTVVIIHPIPNIASISSTNPTTCFGSDGTITLSGLTPGILYFVTYAYNNSPMSIAITADLAGNVILTGLSSGNYSDFSVSSFTCVSNTVGPVTLSDPLPPPPPVLGSNTPICPGATLFLTASSPVSNLTYSWSGPNGFASNEQNPSIPNVTNVNTGLYTLTITHLNCESSSSEEIIIHPAAVLTDVTENTIMPYGGYVQLHAAGVQYYTWTPNNGTINNPNIYNPIAAPEDSTTYTVIGMNEWGCRDSAHVTITINFDAYGSVPTAFSPNGDGNNDVFRIINQKFVKIIDFSIYDRWGKRVYHNTYDPTQGWDGNYNGVPQDIGVYYYHIIIETPNKIVKNLKGDLTLMR